MYFIQRLRFEKNIQNPKKVIHRKIKVFEVDHIYFSFKIEIINVNGYIVSYM